MNLKKVFFIETGIFLLLAIGDGVTTTLGLRRGYYEWNPIARLLPVTYSWFIGTQIAMWALMVGMSYYFTYKKDEGRTEKSLVILWTIAILIKLYPVLNNTWLLIR